VLRDWPNWSISLRAPVAVTSATPVPRTTNAPDAATHEMAAHFESHHRRREEQSDQNRRVMSASSALGRVSAVISSGPSAMPQIGQAPVPT
jgi:hypothetical protein